MNPALTLYHTWKQLLSLYGDMTRASTSVHMGTGGRGIFVGGLDTTGHPIICYARLGYYMGHVGRRLISGDFSLWPDGSFCINHYDNDLKEICEHTFLYWDRVASRKVVFYAPQHQRPCIDPDDYANPIPYFRWQALNTRTRLHLVPDGPSWRIAVHPESDDHARACRTLDLEYDIAARRYLRAQRYDQINAFGYRTPEAILATNREQVNAISMLLEPYRPARRPKEKAHDTVAPRYRDQAQDLAPRRWTPDRRART